MKVLHVIPSLSPHRGGPSVAMMGIALGLAAEGIQVDIATTDDDGPGTLDIPLGVPVAHEGCTVRYFHRQGSFYTFSWPMTRWLIQHVRDYDLVHIHALFSYPALPAALCSISRGVPYVVRPLGTLNRWGMRNRRRLLKLLSFAVIERWILRAAAAIHYTSQSEMDEAVGLAPATSGVIIPLGIDLSDFQHLPASDMFLREHPALRERTLILFLSRLTEKKGLDLLLPAFASIRSHHPSAVILIAGSGDDDFVQQTHKLADELGISEGVVWLGFLEGDRKLAAFSASHIFVLPSYSENFGIAAVEALAAGLATVLSDQVAVASVVAQEGAGVVIPCDVTSLAAAIGLLLSDQELAGYYGERARRVALENFSREAASRKLLDLYVRLIGHSSGAQPQSSSG